MKKELIAGFLPTLTIKTKDFAAELTSHNVIEKNLKADTAISKEHIANNSAVRKMLNKEAYSLNNYLLPKM